MRMIELRDRLRFAFESDLQLRVGPELRRENFDRHIAIEARVAGAINLSHAASAEGRDDLVRPKPRTRCNLHGKRLGLYGSPSRSRRQHEKSKRNREEEPLTEVSSILGDDMRQALREM